jgi:hypothetical protein
MKSRHVYRAVMADLGVGRPDERRLVGHALHFWWQLKGERPMPALSDVSFGPGASGSGTRLYPYLFAVTVAASPDEMSIVHCGPALAEICGKDVTGGLAAQSLPSSMWNKLRYAFAAAATTGKPLASSGRFTNASGRRELFRSIVMPLSSDQRTVDHLLCALNSKLADA